jgi:hypothetical protein
MQPEMDRDAVARERARRRQIRAEQVQHRRMAFGIILLTLVVLVIALVIGLSGRGGGTASSSTTSSTLALTTGHYSAVLTGDNSVPKVTTQATGEFVLTYDSETQQLSYSLDITHQLTKPTTVAIYQGLPGTSGQVVYNLPITNSDTNGVFQGTLSEGTIDEADLTGPLAGKTLADLIALIGNGEAYISVGNPTHLEAIRGPIS